MSPPEGKGLSCLLVFFFFLAEPSAMPSIKFMFSNYLFFFLNNCTYLLFIFGVSLVVTHSLLIVVASLAAELGL